MTDDPLEFMRRKLIDLGAEPAAVRAALVATRKEYAGTAPYIPAIDRPARDTVIQTALAAGKTPKQTARLADCSTATVRRVKRRRSTWL